jgi:hypothetical protein
MKYDDGLGLKQEFLERYTATRGPNLITAESEKAMVLAGSFPIEEALLNKPRNYKLHLDTLMLAAHDKKSVAEYAKYQSHLAAPPNSEGDDPEPELWYDSDPPDDDVNGQNRVADDPLQRFKKVDKRYFKIQNFNMDHMRDFPHKAREGDMPLFLLKEKSFDKMKAAVPDKIMRMWKVTEEDRLAKLRYLGPSA